MDASEAMRLKDLEDENYKPKCLMADLPLNCGALNDGLSEKYHRPWSVGRLLWGRVSERHLSERRAWG